MKIDLTKYKKTGKNILAFFGKRCWLLIIILLFIVIFVAGAVFYQYAYKVVYQEQNVFISGETINQKNYQDIKKRMEKRQQYLQNILNKELSDPFK